MIKLSFRDIKLSYINTQVNVPSGGPYTSTPDQPFNSQEMAAYTGLPQQDSYFCPRCKSINLLVNDNKNIAICKDCQSRFSLLKQQDGNAFPFRSLPRGTGLLDMTQGANSYPSAHDSTEYGGGSWSKELGSGNS